MEMLTEIEEKSWKRRAWLWSFLAVPVILGFYHLLVWLAGSSLFPVIKPSNIPTLLGIVTTFSITMTGFIAAIGAYLLSVSRNPTFSEWRNNGYLSVFFNLYGAAIIFLLATFGACLMMLLAGTTMWWLKIILSLVIVNLMHIVLITYIVVSQSKANDD
ncbi:hypothetical protein [Vibrio campbellii]|uniref:hypothetical protein n=1 Tax=Vibrio campbellii TaxID=680 RepID=UPI0002AE0DDB|nr:hypothetical protein [Vibrio campbellii]ARV75003.1 hypothetical protein A8140_20470 [Vibrio campbellii CAIM 519 = NBRC 15631 = ATCC 25920]ELU52992.1 hypothetical protein B878_05242 [Vibrio campbellii CAIM 519 = NBRC 15631 = ATCC 25920]